MKKEMTIHQYWKRWGYHVETYQTVFIWCPNCGQPITEDKLIATKGICPHCGYNPPRRIDWEEDK